MADLFQPGHVVEDDAPVCAADQPFLFHLADHAVYMHRRQADRIADVLLRQLQVETVTRLLVGELNTLIARPVAGGDRLEAETRTKLVNYEEQNLHIGGECQCQDRQAGRSF